MPKAQPRIMLFDLHSSGHHLQYLSQLTTYWVDNQRQGELDVVVPQSFVDAHPAFRQFVDNVGGSARVRIVVMDDDIALDSSRGLGQLSNDLEHGRLLKKYIAKLRPDHCLLMTFDDCQVAIGKGLRFDFPVSFSGIYFRPINRSGSGFMGLMKRWRKSIMLKTAMRNPHFKWLFCLDPGSVSQVNSYGLADAVFLPDGIELGSSDASRETMRLKWGVEEGRIVGLLFGGVTKRKGVYQVLDACLLLSEEHQAKLCIAFVGVIAESERDEIEQRIDVVRETSGVQLIVRDGFVDEAAVQDIIRGADLNLVVYQRHAGSSGILIRSAAEQIPVLGSDYGLVGENIRNHGLGLALDSTDPSAIALGLAGFLDAPSDIGFDPEAAVAFAGENTATAFCETIFSRLK